MSEPDAPNFAGVPSRAECDPRRARVVLVQAPFEGSVSYGGGTARGPSAILEASRQVETHDDETGIDLEDLSFALGPVVEPEGSDPAGYVRKVRDAVGAVVARGAVPFTLGGEHSVTIGAVQAVRAKFPRAHVLSVDAHADLRQHFEGSEHSHACVIRRVLEGGPATVVGVRSYSGEEARFAARDRSVRLVPAREITRGTASLADLVSSLGDPLYVTFDVDGLDPSVIPATGTPEPGGLSWDAALTLLRAAFERRTVVGMDLVELAPVPGVHVSEFAAARLAAKMLSYLPGTPIKEA